MEHFFKCNVQVCASIDLLGLNLHRSISGQQTTEIIIQTAILAAKKNSRHPITMALAIPTQLLDVLRIEIRGYLEDPPRK